MTEMTSEIADHEEPKDNKYEAFVAGVLKDFDSRVQAIQTSAEINMRAYESYCFELKRQLEVCQAENHKLRKKLSSTTSEQCGVSVKGGSDDSARLEDINSLFQSMTCLSVKVLSSGAEEKQYLCQLLDGTLKGVQFHLTLNQSSWEYTYEPQGDATQLLEDISPELATSVVFPDYMLSRFLVNLLKANYITTKT